MRKLFVILFSSLIALLSTSVMADGWHTERWVDENGFERSRIVDDNDPPMTDEELEDWNRMVRESRNPDPPYPSVPSVWTLEYDGPGSLEFREQGTGKRIIIQK